MPRNFKTAVIPVFVIVMAASLLSDAGNSAQVPAAPARGAAHWAFTAPARPALPAVKNKAWARNAIDYFTLAAMERQGLAPSPEADRTTLIRRLSLDLTGLPPAIAEIDRFLADRAPDAYEKLVDRLLASPHYGERQARHWLDLARYADTNGYEKDVTRSIWPYRDWVIRAFNEDKPFDQFTIEQLAGDLLPKATAEQRIATGFLRNSMRNEEGSVQPEQFRVEGLIDRVDAIGKTFLGLSVSCAQCHTHKFDPIRHDEYYKFYAFLNSDEEPYLEVPDEKVTARRAEIQTKITKVEDELLARDTGLPARMAAWEARARAYEDTWQPLKIDEFFSSRAKIDEYHDDGSVRVESYRYLEATFFVKAKTDLQNITGVRLELLTDPSLRHNGPGASENGTLSLTDFALEAAPADGSGKPEKIVFAGAQADFERPGAPPANALDNDPKTGWSSDAGPLRRNQDRKLVFTTKPFGFAKGTKLSFTMGHTAGAIQITGRFRLSVTTAHTPPFDPLPADIRRIVALPAGQRTARQQRALLSHFMTIDPECAAVAREITELLRTWPEATATLVLAPRSSPRTTHVFKRGDWRKPDTVVTPDTPAFLHPFPAGAPRNRLGLAQWMVAPENPLTARVVVNRAWQQFFGAGLVATPEDFGVRCETPSHPELLDWLAVGFMNGEFGIRNGESKTAPRPWGMKAFLRLIVTSATYRQSSASIPHSEFRAPHSMDPYNRWLARAPRLRVEAEIIRDAALATAGLLHDKIGGPPAFPPIPDGVLDLSFGGAMKWETPRGEQRYRRAMYTFWKRSIPYPGLSAFDAPNADVSCPRRARSNTPLQALTTLNDKMFMEAAQGLALRVWKEGGADDRARLAYAFRLCLARLPDDFEARELLRLLETEYRNFEGKTAQAVYVGAIDMQDLPPDVDLHKVAAWTMVARVLLNLDEMITRR
ncbi:MAG: DUF1549 and DUF1553 domain-containing protein [Blastocatellia bacterium]